MAESAIVFVLLLPLLFEKLACGTLEQLGKVLGVRRELEKLQSKLTTIQSVLRDSEEKEVKDAALRNWLAKLKNTAYLADDMLDEAHYELLWRSVDIHHGFKSKVNDFSSSSYNPLFFRAKMAREVKDVVERLNAIAKELAFKLPLEDRQCGRGRAAVCRRLVGLGGLTALRELPDEMGGLTLLEELEIIGCPLPAALPMGLQQRLPHLKYLYIDGCPQLEILLAPYLPSSNSEA